MSHPRFFVPELVPGTGLIDLPDDEAHHLTRVLRLGVNDLISVFDGRGGEWTARVAAIGRDGATVSVGPPIVTTAEPPVYVTLAAGLLKGDQMDDVIRDATMMGVRAIVPMDSAHVTVPERAWKGTRALERWRRVAVASAKQCRRAVVPEIQAVRAFDAVVAEAKAEGVARFICLEPARQDDLGVGRRAVGTVAEPGAEAPRLHGAVPAKALVLVGPEGGWSEAEVAAVAAAGFEPLVLGPRTIRAERAPLVALSVLWTRWGW